jgi:hypothetical protein
MRADSFRDPRAVAGRAVRELLVALAEVPGPTAFRLADAEGRLACLLVVWTADRAMPVASSERLRRAGGRAECKRDVVDVVKAANRPLTRKEVMKALKAAGKTYGTSMVEKALADLTATGQLVNPKDKKGYRLPSWDRERPTLFD